MHMAFFEVELELSLLHEVFLQLSIPGIENR